MGVGVGVVNGVGVVLVDVLIILLVVMVFGGVGFVEFVGLLQISNSKSDIISLSN